MAVPWTQIIRWAPQIIVLSRELLQRSRRMPENTPAPATESRSELVLRIAVLEDHERRQAELIEQMAEQQAELAQAVVALHRRERLLIFAILIVLGLAIWALLR